MMINEKPYKYDEWLKSLHDENGNVDHVMMLYQFVSVTKQHTNDPNSAAGKNIWLHGLTYVDYYLSEQLNNAGNADIDEEDIYSQ